VDQGGNVAEWTETAPAAGQRVVRGGGFQDPPTTLAASGRSTLSEGTAHQSIGFRVATLPVSICTDGVLEGLEECDDGNTTVGDGCYSTCHFEDEMVLSGVAQGGSATVSIFGIDVTVTTSAGQSATVVNAALAAQANANATLAGLGVSAVALGNRLVTNGTIMAVDLQDPGLEECGASVPALPGWGLLLLAMALIGVALGWRGGRPWVRGLLACSALLPILAAGPLASAQPGPTCTPHPAVLDPNNGLVAGLGINVGGLVVEVEVVVSSVFRRTLVADQFALDIEITSVNGLPHEHGTDIVLLSNTTLFFEFGDLSNILVDWTMDTVPIESPDLYTTCVQIVLGAIPIGVERCTFIQF
jgi:cysteine-rich repeat protein